jgi:hypothetical protein
VKRLENWLVDRAKLLAQLAVTQTEEFDLIKDEYAKQYDQCLWEIATATEAQLTQVFRESWACDLPVPIHTILCQRLALITTNPEMASAAIRTAKSYANPGEDINVALGVEDWKV